MEVRFSILKKPGPGQSRVAVFSVVRNEMYFLPHFLRHYRNLGAREFWLLDDRSSDGSREFLLAQPDCGVIQSSLTYGDRFGELRFGVAVKTLVPNKLLQGRWVLTVDADEFLVLPQALPSLPALTGALEGEGLKVARALMLDFFPASLRALADASAADDPFALCPYFDAWQAVDWPDRSPPPGKVLHDGVRPRMLARLLETSPAMRSLLPSYRFATPFKVPLLFWEGDTRMLSAHLANVLPSDRIQLALAHFKFYPGYEARIADALRTNAYWQDSTEYRFLDIAARELSDWPLIGPRSRRFDSPGDLEQAGLVFSRLARRAGT
jgi:hypothetical protein